MQLMKARSIGLAVVMSLAAVFIMHVVLGEAAPGVTQGVEASMAGPVSPLMAAQSQSGCDDCVFFTVGFTGTADTEITDLSGNLLGLGEHSGEVRCNSSRNCNKSTELYFTYPLTDSCPWCDTEYEYKFGSRLMLDPVAERAIVAGTGTASNRNQKESFTFSATIENNRDGTVSVTYVASQPDASFVIPRAPGTFTISERR